MLVRLLAPPGFEVREAANGEEAVAAWEQWRPHLIWMDLRMPVMDGREATRRIREREKDEGGRMRDESGISSLIPHPSAFTKIIALTASSFEEERAEVLAAGCDDFLRKPFDEAHLFELIHKHLGVRFIYAGGPAPAAEVTQPEPEVAALESLPSGLLGALERALVRLDTGAVSAAIEEISARDARSAEALAALAGDFQYGRILQLIRGSGGQDSVEEQA